MDRVIKRYVRYLGPGSFVAEEWTRELESLDPAAVEWPDNAYAFTLHERVDVLDGPDVFRGVPRKVGPTYYHPDSKIETLAEAERNPRATRILLSNMRGNGWGRIIWSRWGNWPQPFDPAEHMVLPRISMSTGEGA